MTKPLPSRIPLLALAGAFLFSACTREAGEKWPTVSFGEDIEAIEAAHKGPSSRVVLPPVPPLPENEKTGMEEPARYLLETRAAYGEIRTALKTERAAYENNLSALESGTEGKRDTWLSVQASLTRLSQTVEELPRIRARLSLIGDEVEVSSLRGEVEALELDYRRFLRGEKVRLASAAQ